MQTRRIELIAIAVLALAGCPSGEVAGDDDTVAPADDDSAGIDDDDTADVEPYGPAFYPADRTHSPITPFVADALRDAMDLDNGRPDVFAKVGDSLTDSSSALACFAGDSVALGDHGDLEGSWLHFLDGDAAGSTPFDRWSLAAEGGMTANWAISGAPSPLDQEISAISPSIALVQYGTNDMGMGTTHASAMWGYYEDMVALVDTCLDHGIVPVLMTIPHRGDYQTADWWVLSYNDVIRGLAQSRQVPFVDLHRELDVIPGHGLTGDGVHMDSAGAGPCALTADGLQHGNNVRNLLWLEALDRVAAAVLHGVESLDEAEPLLAGGGSPDEPFEIPQLPFADLRDTTASAHSNLALYSGCESDSDESGPEYLYRLEVTESVRVRAIVLDLDGVDIDIHLLDHTASEEGCLQRDHHLVEGTLQPGTYHFALDSWNDGESAMAGEYLFVVTECHPDDPDCD
jgi:lysophospholipase L1-like esterase